MDLAASPFSSTNLRKKPKRFVALLGVSIDQFDAIFEKVYQTELAIQKRHLSLRQPKRVERMVSKQRDNLREYLCITLLYLRQYNIQEVLATSFGISQARISKIIHKVSLLLEEALPVPQKAAASIYETLKQIDPHLLKQYDATLIVDASEQRIERSEDKTQQRLDYSGKKSAIAENSR